MGLCIHVNYKVICKLSSVVLNKFLSYTNNLYISLYKNLSCRNIIIRWYGILSGNYPNQTLYKVLIEDFISATMLISSNCTLDDSSSSILILSLMTAQFEFLQVNGKIKVKQ